jgi:aerotaxis receptor
MTNLKERRGEARPITGEAPFDVGEVFYSRTDQRGIILSGNFVFRRVADYPWEDLIGAPHKIIRHPDMPKGVFQIFWSHLKRGDMVGAYVKNKAKAGLHYWVYAVAMPWREGFLSARIKPTSAQLAKVQRLYAQALEREQKEGLSPEASAEAILADLTTLGFDTYSDFAIDSLSEELLAESQKLGLPPIARVKKSQEMLEQAEILRAQTEGLSAEFENLSGIPINMQIRATRLENKGGPIMTLAQTYGDMSNTLSDWFAKNVVGADSNFSRISENVKQALFLNSAAGILHRCNSQLQAERRDLGDLNLNTERDGLVALANSYIRQARDSTRAVMHEAERINSATKEMRRSLLALDTVRVTCNIENARLGTKSDGLSDIVTNLGVAQTSVAEKLDQIDSIIARVNALAQSVCSDDTENTPPVLLYGEKMAAALQRAG